MDGYLHQLKFNEHLVVRCQGVANPGQSHWIQKLWHHMLAGSVIGNWMGHPYSFACNSLEDPMGPVGMNYSGCTGFVPDSFIDGTC